MFKFNPIDLNDLIAIIALGIGFILSITYNMNELAMSVATGFFGYIGGIASGVSKTEKKTGTNQSDDSPSLPNSPTENKNE